MISISILLMFVGVWCCYQTSHRAELLSPNKLEAWLRAHRNQAYLIGLIGFLSSFVLILEVYGIGSGIFAYILSLTIISSIIIILAPLHYLKIENVGLVFFCSLILEIV
jgi:hypothetical protein